MVNTQGVWGTGEKGHLFKGNKGRILRETGEKDNIGEQGTYENNFFAF